METVNVLYSPMLQSPTFTTCGDREENKQGRRVRLGLLGCPRTVGETVMTEVANCARHGKERLQVLLLSTRGWPARRDVRSRNEVRVGRESQLGLPHRMAPPRLQVKKTLKECFLRLPAESCPLLAI